MGIYQAFTATLEFFDLQRGGIYPLNLFSVKFTYTRSLVPLFSMKGYRSLYRIRVSFR